ncbi:MAG: branched-chain amino acid ABC transporter permease [Armatimonadota bacterium]|nr:branched-chain amino acid ABC transporter permease [Armatimonadota bacterium]MDR7449590.1 branched-chain amino acid ABC transporter permease [Armatimonadota bacterium]MDR7460219.1 branched-chain amino acid ABC transporter permease [Armatimonadota bacterium]MDR7480306.1 branched-chain amino acid ABC transporter permease [Armatimonadota bacterium]MDR7489130.1 branched-chain amino acid ABC transporter permease [Armatimonadota bacterium]
MDLLVQATLNGLLLGLVYALVALGLSLIWGVMEVVNLAHAEYLMLAMYATYWLWALGRVDPLVAAPVVLPLFFLLGWLTYRVLVRRVLAAPMVSQIFATFGLLFFLRYSAFAAFGPNVRGIWQSRLEGSLTLGPWYVGVPQLAAAVVALGAFALLWLFLNRTKTGKALQATAQDRVVAQTLGIDVEQMFALAWGVGIAAVALAGISLMPFYQVSPTVGDAFLLIAFASVVLGGFGTVAGALVGGIGIGLVENVLGALIAPTFKLLFAFAVFVLMLLVRPQGLVGE